MGKQKNISHLASEIIRGKWLLADAGAYLPTAFALLSRAPMTATGDTDGPSFMLSDGTLTSDSAETEVQKKVAILPLHGTMTKYETCTSDGTSELASAIKRFADREDIVAIVLDIDSGGGAANAVPPLVEAIRYARSTGMPVIAHCDLCCSAAFWVASQCGLIYLDNDMSEIGSVGVVCTLSLPPEKDPQTGVRIVPVYARESTQKNLDYRKAQEGDYSLIQDSMSPIVAQFREAVTQGRPDMDTTVDGVLDGKTFLCEEALKIGLADARKTLAETVEAAFALAEI